jgi:cation:H+ antiporter
MLAAVLFLLAGAAVLTVGAEAAIRGAGRLAEARRISPFVIGALLFGIDLESLGAALVAAGRGQSSIAAGEAFGTVLFLFSVAFGMALLVAPRPVQSPPPNMVLLPGAALLIGAASIQDRVVTRQEGVLLVAAYACYLVLVVYLDRRAPEQRAQEIEREAREGPPLPWPLLLIGGLGLVYAGATVLVEGGVRILARTSLAAGFVGGALIGTLASLDEVLLEVIPVLHGTPQLATGNLLGTAAAFTTGVIGLAALVRPLQIDSAAASAYLAAAVLYTVVAVAFLGRGRAGRAVGVTVIVLYGLWLAYAARL